MSHLYTVTLHQSSLPPAQRQDVEMRYRQMLEQMLGGVEGVLRDWSAWYEAEHIAGSLSHGTWQVARQWLIAADRARDTALTVQKAALDAADPYFEVQRL